MDSLLNMTLSSLSLSTRLDSKSQSKSFGNPSNSSDSKLYSHNFNSNQDLTLKKMTSRVLPPQHLLDLPPSPASLLMSSTSSLFESLSTSSNQLPSNSKLMINDSISILSSPSEPSCQTHSDPSPVIFRHKDSLESSSFLPSSINPPPKSSMEPPPSPSTISEFQKRLTTTLEDMMTVVSETTPESPPESPSQATRRKCQIANVC